MKGSGDTSLPLAHWVPLTSCGVLQEREKLIDPAIKGVENALNAATRSGTVDRVVLTSSVAAVVGDNWERGKDHVFTEKDWDLSATDSYLPYHRWFPFCIVEM
jgi:nucleoside-diphosphate-sugar epimerase